MRIRKLDPESFVDAYNVDLQLLYPWEGVVEPPFGAAWAVLAPGQSTKPHAHQECESFFVARGSGVMRVGEETTRVETGHVTFHTPFDSHVLHNDSDEDLLFLTVWWEDRERWEAPEDGAAEATANDGGGGALPAEAETARAAEREPARRRVLVTAAPPTPNGDLHLGHLAGPYLSADYHARWLRLAGHEAAFVCGSDDNSVYVPYKGRELGKAGQETADHLTAAIVESLEAAGVELADFPRPNASPHHRRLVQDFFRVLHEKGAIVEREEPAAFCPRCDVYAFEPLVRGECPHCGAGMTGVTCEVCARISRALELVDPACTACGSALKARPVRRLVFPLEPHRERLVEYYRREVTMPARLRALVEALLAEELPEVPVTHPVDWGIEVPVPGWEGQRIWVWLEMAPRYLAYAEHVEDARTARGACAPDDGGEEHEVPWHRWWRSSGATVVQFYGYDNAFYYTVMIPALLAAFDPEIRLPEVFVVNEFYRLDGEKFSTTRDHRILARDLLAEAPRDAVRFHLAWTAPEREETNFTRDEMRATVERELAGGLEAWRIELAGRLAEAGGAVPATGDWTSEQRGFYERLRRLFREAGEAWGAEGFSPQRAVRVLSELVREARRFGRGQSHWRQAASRGEELRTALALEVLAAKLAALVAAPVMPEAAGRLWRALGLPAEDRIAPPPGAWNDAFDWVPSGLEPRLGEPLVPGLGEWLERTGPQNL